MPLSSFSIISPIILQPPPPYTMNYFTFEPFINYSRSFDLQLIHQWFVSSLDYIGTLAFAISGIRLASAKNFDLFGAYVMGLATAIGGGTVRDIMLGLPIFWMQHGEIYFSIVAAALILVWLFREHVVRRDNTWFLFDTVGLGMFTVIGIEKALGAGQPMWVAMMMGALTGAGGGVIRDVFLNEIPLIFRAEIYALACLIGGLFYWVGTQLHLSPVTCGFACGASVILTRIRAVRYNLHLPVVHSSEGNSDFPA